VRGWLGVSIQPVTPDIASAFHLTGTPRGALVGDVTPQSPADTSGIRKGDIILAINGDTVRDSRQLALRISELSPGASVRLHILRDGKEMDQTMVLGEAPPAGVSSNAPAQSGSGAAPKLGISVVPLTPDLARQLNLPGQTSGAVISEVDPGSPAEEAGLQRGDVIQEVNRQTVRKPEDVEQALSSSGSGPLLLLIDRSGNHIFVTVHQARG
jgi:serine protease Do